MLTRPISTRTTLLLAAIVLMAPFVVDRVQAAPAKPPQYCAAMICADATHIASSKLTRGPDFVVHNFKLKDGSGAGVYVGGHPQTPAAGTPKTAITIDGVACDRFATTPDGKHEVAVYCKWDDRTVIHAFTDAAGAPDKSDALALIKTLRHCDEKTECPWPQN